MDYGHTNQESEKRLDNSQAASNWDVIPKNEHDARAIGGQAIFSAESIPDLPPETPNGLGVIKDVEPLPRVEQPAPAPTFDEPYIAPQGDRIGGEAAHAVETVIGEFKAPFRSLSETYTELQRLREVYQSKLRGNR